MQARRCGHGLSVGIPGAVLCILLLGLPQRGQGQCRPAEGKVTFSHEGPCVMKKQVTRVQDRRAAVDVTAIELTCGRLTLGSLQRALQQAVQICRDNREDPNPGAFYISRTFTVVGRFEQMVSVDQEEGSFSGGAHPAAAVRRRTFSLVTGKELGLQEIFAGQAGRILKQAQEALARRNADGGFQIDPRAFAILVTRGRATVEFAMPHATEVHRGETLKITVRAPALPRSSPR